MCAQQSDQAGEKKKIVIVDKYEAVRELLGHYLQLLPDFEVVGQADRGFEAMQLFKRTAPNLAVIDLCLPELCGKEVILRTRRELPKTRIVVFTGSIDAGILKNALQVGPSGMVHKAEPLELLVFALRMVGAGGRFFSPKISSFLGYPESEPAESLSPREMEIMQSVAEGKSTKEIAALLGVATKTVENHRGRLMRKLGVHNAASITLIAVKMGIVSASSVPTRVLESGPLPQPSPNRLKRW